MYNNLENLFDANNRIATIDVKIKNVALYSYEEEATERVLLRLIKLKRKKDEIKQEFNHLASKFNTLDSNTRKIVGNIYKNKMQVPEVAKALGVSCRYIYRKLDKADRYLEKEM